MAYGFVQSVENTPGSNVINITGTAGNGIILASRTSSGAGTPTVTGAQTNGAAALTSRIATFQNGAGEWYSVLDILGIASGVTSITATFNGGTPGSCWMCATEYSGLASFIVASAGNYQTSPGTGADLITSGTVTNVTSQPALIMGIIGPGFNGDTVAGTGYTTRLSSGGGFFCVVDARATSTGNKQILATAPTHGGTDNYETFLVSYAETGGAVASSPGLDHRSQTFLAMGRR